ncbi:MAG: preprotein translocase subunit YajC [Bacteroidota bacterium]|nr:preprotein translocase subunit YajC [Bacteroidota bacterium]|tara:strand:- start:304 stop:576 length:273 start_codon:yes stop_codon:yes gene_type:complete
MDSSVFLILMIGIMVVFLILPQTLRSRKEKKFKNNLKKGDLIITKGGIHGKIIDVNNTNDTCVIETMAGKVKIERTSISYDMTLARNPKK